MAPLVLRAATVSDARLLLEWRNDLVTRAVSINSSSVEWDEHVSWLTKRLAQADPALYIGEASGVPVGTLRIDGGQVSYTVAPEFRGEGFGTAMLIEARRLFGPLVARIKANNAASIRAATRAGHIVVLISGEGQVLSQPGADCVPRR